MRIQFILSFFLGLSIYYVDAKCIERARSTISQLSDDDFVRAVKWSQDTNRVQYLSREPVVR